MPKKYYSNTKISIGGSIAPYPFRGDLGSALKRAIEKQRSSAPLVNFMQTHLNELKKRAGEHPYTFL